MTNQLPAHLQNRQSRAVGKTLQDNLGGGSPPHLSIENSRFTLIDAVGNQQLVPTHDPQIGVYIDVNIIDANEHLSRVFWGQDKVYNPAERLPPLCWSDNGVAPSRQAQEPQSDTCGACQWSVWGSATSKVTGKGVPACAELQKIAFTTAGHRTVFLLRIPPNSLKNLRTFQGGLAGSGVDPSDVVTRISFVPGIQGTLQFQAVDYIDPPTMELRESVLLAHATDNIVGRNDVPRPAGLPAPATQALSSPLAGEAIPQAGIPASSMPSAGPQPQAAPVQPVSFPSTVTATAPIPNATVQPAASPSKRRGRPPAQSQQPAQAQFAPSPAPFPNPNRTTEAAPRAPFPSPNGAGPSNNFGIQPGVAPNAELAATLNTLFPK